MRLPRPCGVSRRSIAQLPSSVYLYAGPNFGGDQTRSLLAWRQSSTWSQMLGVPQILLERRMLSRMEMWMVWACGNKTFFQVLFNWCDRFMLHWMTNRFIPCVTNRWIQNALTVFWHLFFCHHMPSALPVIQSHWRRSSAPSHADERRHLVSDRFIVSLAVFLI